MGDRAPVHITIGGTLPREHLEVFAAHAADYDLRTEWDGEPFDAAALVAGEPLELYGTELKREMARAELPIPPFVLL